MESHYSQPTSSKCFYQGKNKRKIEQHQYDTPAFSELSNIVGNGISCKEHKGESDETSHEIFKPKSSESKEAHYDFKHANGQKRRKL